MVTEELQRRIERHLLLRDLVGGVREPQVGPDVELDEVGAGIDRRLQRRKRVLGCDRRRATVTDHERWPFGPAKHHRRLITTIAQSSARFCPANARHAATTASAIACAGSPACATSALSRRSTPNCSEPLRASITPSV